MRLLICAGGTGGGVYPALSVQQALGDEGNTFLWVGGTGGMEAELVQRYHIPFTSVPAAGVHGVGIRRLPGNIVQLISGTTAAGNIIHNFKPDVLFFTGGYVSVPVAVAGRRFPILLFLPDIEPGMALRFTSRFADCIALSAETSKQYFGSKKNIVVTGYPTRPELNQWTKSTGRKVMGIASQLPVVLVLGGSKGARSINRALLAVLPGILESAEVVHISGQLDWPEVEAARTLLSPILQPRYHAYPYLHEEMGAALASADLAISRAGASILGEYPLFGIPAILVPYPHAWRYQKVNAEVLASKGGAIILRDEDLGKDLMQMITHLLADRVKLDTMRNAMLGANPPDAAGRIAALLQNLASGGKG